MRKFLIISSTVLFMGGAAHAADLGQYRPGNPYQSVIAPGADVCQSHCAGDAQCRSWNYVKASPQAAGVCEFNANDVPPVSSAISISGSNSPARYRRGVVPGGTNTIRVGTAPVSQNPTESSALSSPNRRIVKEAVPQQKQVQTALTEGRAIAPPRNETPHIATSQRQSLTAQKNQYRQVSPNGQRAMSQSGSAAVPQTFTYDLGGNSVQPRQMQQAPRMQQGSPMEQAQRQATRPQNPVAMQSGGGQPYPPQGYATQNSAPQNYMPQNVTPPYRSAPPVQTEGAMTRADRRRQQGPSGQYVQGRQEQMAYQPQPVQEPGQGLRQGQAFPPQMTGSPENYAPQYAAQNAPQSAPQNVPMTRRSATDPVTYGEITQSRLNASTPYPSAPKTLARGLTAEQAQQSLFGKLNDDVQVPNSGGAVPEDPGAPIPTMSSRDSGMVEQSSLAGGPSGK